MIILFPFSIPSINPPLMHPITRIFCGLTLLTVPTIEFGGYFLLSILSGNIGELGLTGFQESMFRAGHGHAGVLVILSLIALFLSDYARLSQPFLWLVRAGFPLSAMLISGGFFAAALGEQLNQPNGMIALLYVGVILLAVALITLGIGLVRKPA